VATAGQRKGDQFERDVVQYLTPWWPRAERRRARGVRLDRGDLVGIDGWVVECKDHASIDLAGFVDQAAQEAENAGVSRYVAVVKRRRRGIDQAYAVMPLRVWADVASAAA
jgi:hypothetical protein